MRRCLCIVLLVSASALGVHDGTRPSREPLRIHARRGALRNMRGGRVALPRKDRDAEAAARTFVLSHRAFGMKDRRLDLTVERTRARGPRRFIRFQQTFAGIPVFAANVVVQISRETDVEFVASNGVTDAQSDNASLGRGPPLLSAAEAMGLVKSMHPDMVLWGTPELMFYSPTIVGLSGPISLVWRVETMSEALLVDAHEGAIVLRYPLQTSLLERRIYDLHCQRNWDWANLARVEGGACGYGLEVDLAYDYAGDAYAFFFDHHGRDGLDDAGTPILCLTNYAPTGETDCGYFGAFWSQSGRYLAFGPGTVFDDVLAHEYTHGVTQHTSGIIYLNESGAINEHFSDVWGEFIDQTNGRGDDSAKVRWLIGEEMVKGGVRSMKDPTRDGYPDRRGSAYWRAVFGETMSDENDYGWVHCNNGVGNKLCYLLTDGDTFNGYRIAGMGIDAIAELYYEVQTGLLTRAPDYTDLYFALLQAAENLAWTPDQKANLERACRAVEIASVVRKYYATDVPKDVRSGTVESSTTIDESQIIGDLNVKVELSHRRLSDLSIRLISPSATAVSLVTKSTEYDSVLGFGFYGTVFDDQALCSVAEGQEPFTGSFRPLESLNTLNGEDAQGTWTLEITDHRDQAHGQLIAWSIELG